MGIINEQKILKALQEEVRDLKKKIEAKKEIASQHQRELQIMVNRRERLTERVKILKHNVPEVTDHAVIRYLERVRGLDIEGIRSEILSPEVIQQMEVLGTTGKFVNKNLQIVVKNNKVITVYGDSGNNI